MGVNLQVLWDRLEALKETTNVVWPWVSHKTQQKLAITKLLWTMSTSPLPVVRYKYTTKTHTDTCDFFLVNKVKMWVNKKYK